MDKRTITAPINGKLGGRPLGTYGENHKLSLAMKIYISEQLEKHKVPLIKAMLNKALQGDVMAFNALVDRAHGKAVQGVEMSGKDGNPIVFMPLELIQKHALQVAESVAQDEEPLHVDSKVVESIPVESEKVQ